MGCVDFLFIGSSTSSFRLCHMSVRQLLAREAEIERGNAAADVVVVTRGSVFV